MKHSKFEKDCLQKYGQRFKNNIKNQLKWRKA